LRISGENEVFRCLLLDESIFCSEVVLLGPHTLPLQDILTQYYRNLVPELTRALPPARHISSPLLLSVRREYESARRRLLIVGQETHNWYATIDFLKQVANPVEKLQSCYERFELGRCYQKSFFCKVTHEIQNKLEPFVPPLGFMWSNLFPCDEKGETPSHDVADTLRSFRILPNEIAILQPDAIILFTGPNYDYTLQCYFPGVIPKQIVSDIPNRQLAQLTHKDLRPLTFRTYHPSYLRRSRKLWYVDLIVDAVKKTWVAETRKDLKGAS